MSRIIPAWRAGSARADDQDDEAQAVVKKLATAPSQVMFSFFYLLLVL
jgi:hypothetical protein